MKTPFTEMAFVLDRSGSMHACLEPAIKGFNDFLRKQREEPGAARFTLIQFDDQYEVHAFRVPISEMVELTTHTYVPRGSTALLDAVGRTVDELERWIEEAGDGEKPAGVIVAILTDGLENSSQRYTWKDVAGRIARLRQDKGWEFLFLGAGPDAIAQASQLAIAPEAAAAFPSSAAGHARASAGLARKMAALRKLKTGAAMSADEQGDMAKPMEEILREEEGKQEEQK